MRRAAHGGGPLPREVQRTIECVRWLAESNYEVHFDPVRRRLRADHLSRSPPTRATAWKTRASSASSKTTAACIYYATYTAYNGRAILPQLLETTDFLSFRARTLNGRAVQNKGMALFPRRIGGRYAMISRQDDENLYLMFSDNPHFWSDPQFLRRPRQPWEAVKIGNCGSPIETEAGWLVITHGVGPMRKYCIGALLLDLDDPSKVIGELTEPLLHPEGNEREGYVPNVVYTCGALAAPRPAHPALRPERHRGHDRHDRASGPSRGPHATLRRQDQRFSDQASPDSERRNQCAPAARSATQRSHG